MTPRLHDLVTRLLDGGCLTPPEMAEARRLLGHRPMDPPWPYDSLPVAVAVAREEAPPRTADAFPLAHLQIDPFA